jgi:hypothetical protein
MPDGWRNVAISLTNRPFSVSVNAGFDNYRFHTRRDAEEKPRGHRAAGSSVAVMPMQASMKLHDGNVLQDGVTARGTHCIQLTVLGEVSRMRSVQGCDPGHGIFEHQA